MERYEVKVKYDQIKRLMNFERYSEAMEIANTIDWDRSKNINMLCVAGEIYERCGYFEDSKAIYLRAHQLQPQSRIVIYRLAELSIKLRDYEDSIHFYKEYEDVAPYDVNLYVLRYKIYQARGAATETLISILEELKETDYHERWAYELAKLYAEMGMVDKCVEECNEINLWFGNGRYVRKALQLKKRFQPLTKEQQQKLDEAQPKPHHAEETINGKEAAEEKQRQAQQQFEALQNGQREDREKARKDALDAAREARAASLLQEAQEEAKEEEATQDAKDDREFIGQGLMPEFNVRIPNELKPPVMEQPAPFAMKEESKASVEEEEATAEIEPETEQETELKTEQEIQPETEQEPQPAFKSELFPTLTRPKEDQTSEKSSGPTESDILAENIALALGGKLPRPRREQHYEDEFIRDSFADDYINGGLDEDETFVGDLDSLQESDQDDGNLSEEDFPEKDLAETDSAKAASGEDFLEDEEDQDSQEEDQTPEDDFEDDYERDNPPEDDTTPEDEASFAKRESAFRRMWRKTSNVVSRKQKKATVIAREQDYDIQIKPVVVSRYDTINLQKELARSIRAIMNATEKEEVEKTMEDMNRSMEESNIPKLIQTKRLNIQEVQQAMERIETGEIPGSLADEAKQLESRMQRLLGEDYDGQMRMLVEEAGQTEKQITGQMHLNDLFQEEHQKQLEEMKKKALEQTEEYIDQLCVAVPYIDEMEEVTVEDRPEGGSGQDVLDQARKLMDTRLESKEDLQNVVLQLTRLLGQEAQPEETAAEKIPAEENPAVEEIPEEIVTETEEQPEEAAEEKAVAEEEVVVEEEQPAEAVEETVSEAVLTEEETEIPAEPMVETVSDEEAPAEEEIPEEPAAEAEEQPAEAVEEVAEIPVETMVETASAEEEPAEEEIPVEPMVETVSAEEAPAEEKIPEEPAAEVEEEVVVEEEQPVEAVEEPAEEEAEIPAEEEIPAEPMEEAVLEEAPAEEEIPEEPAAEAEEEVVVEEEQPEEAAEEVAEETAEEVAEETAEEAQPEEDSPEKIQNDQKQILSYFMKFSGVEEEISAFLNRQDDDGENFVITGTEGTGRTSLALRLLKAIARMKEGQSRKVAKLPAGTLNQKPVKAIFAKVEEGTLIIEHAEELQENACSELADMMEAYAKKIRVILIGEEQPVQKLLSGHDDLSSYFAYCFHLHEYNNNELVEFAKAYAYTQGYTMDEVAVLALYTRLADAKTKKQAVMLGDVKEIVNHAIEASEKKKGIKKLFSNLVMKNVDKDGNLILREKDFEAE